MYYMINKLYKVAEIVIENGCIIPDENDIIIIHDHDETKTEITLKVRVIKIINKYIIDNDFILSIMYSKIDKL